MAKRLEFDNDTGIITIRIADATGTEVTYSIRPPLLGALRDLDILAARIERGERAELERDAAAVAPDEVPAEVAEALTARPLHELVADVLPWWRLLFEKCSDTPLPDDDLCPPWFGATIILARVQTFWTLHPFLALGSTDPPTASQ